MCQDYDKEIQSMLGFYSLCSYVLDKSSSRSVYLGVCPVQFALYLRICTASDHVLNKDSVKKSCKNYCERIDACATDRWVGNEILIVTTVFSCTVIQWKKH